jgi:hypothetical protein
MNTLAIGGAFVAVLAATAVYAQSQAPMPTEFAEGERWEARMTITPDVGAPPTPSRTVIKAEGALRFQNHRGNVYALNVPYEASPFFNTKSLNAWRQWPLEVGKTWVFEGEFSLAGSTAKLRQTATVVGIEEVAVPAGTFRAFKITYIGVATAAGQTWTRNETYWYAPTAKADVKATIETPTHQGSIELTSYRPGPGK